MWGTEIYIAKLQSDIKLLEAQKRATLPLDGQLTSAQAHEKHLRSKGCHCEGCLGQGCRGSAAGQGKFDNGNHISQETNIKLEAASACVKDLTQQVLPHGVAPQGFSEGAQVGVATSRASTLYCSWGTCLSRSYALLA